MSSAVLSILRQKCLLGVSVIFSRKGSLWTSDKIVKSPHKDIVIPNRTLPEHIWENLERWSDKTAIACGVTNRSYSYHQVYKFSRNFAAKLRTHFHIKDGDVVCIMMSNSPEYAIAVLGALEAGAEVTTVNPIYTSHEVQRQITLSEPKLLIGMPDTIHVLKEALSMSKIELPVINVNTEGNQQNGTASFLELAFDDTSDKSILKKVRRERNDIAFLPYSSGTTGLPKGVELTNENIVANCLQQDVNTVKHYNDTTDINQDSALAVLPFYHIYGLSIVMLHKLSVGIKIVTLPKFHPQTFLSALKEHKINILCAAPPIILFLATHKDVTKQSLESLKVVTSGAAPLPRNDVDRLMEKLPVNTDFLQLYGLTETSPLATAMLPRSTNYSTSGFAVSNTELRIVDANHVSLGPDEVGELLIRGPQVMKGYRNNTENTKAAFAEDGWFKSGDLATINKDGEVTIADRLKELIKVKGYQVPPAELENLLKEHPDVLDAAVVGIPDQRTGEVPKAFVVLKDGRTAIEKDIIDFVSKKVAEYKRIKELMFVDALPKNPSGKILRRELKKMYC